jgi:hypothetical protein
LTFLRFDVFVFSSTILWLSSPATGQVQSPPPAPAPAPQPAPAQGQPPGRPAAVPDYPDPRTFTLGIFYWVTGPGTNPSLESGHLATDLETLKDLGKAHRTPGVEASIPISRTGALHFEYFRTKGDGNQTAAADTALFSTQFYKGDYLATQYQVQGAKLYLDDLLYPHKFPVARFRIKSLWEAQFVRIKSTIDAPLILSGETGTGSRQIVFPTFGLAAEYAIAPHVLFRAAGSGFGLYHKADLWDGEATISYRRGNWEIVGGGKAFHFKTSPNNTEYMTATFAGAFAGVRWHWSL